MIPTKKQLEKLEQHQIAELAEFIVMENVHHHSNEQSYNYREEIKSIFKEESSYFSHSEIYVAKDFLGFIIGSIRVLKWNYLDILPIQKLFGINPILTSEEANDIFHIGRFAIKKEIRDIKLLKQLMVLAIAPVCQHKRNLAYAECDSKLLRLLNLMGIQTTVLGRSINYLGSETIPISMSYNSLISFYNKNIGIIDTKTIATPQRSKVHKSVVSNYYQHYYSFV